MSHASRDSSSPGSWRSRSQPTSDSGSYVPPSSGGLYRNFTNNAAPQAWARNRGANRPRAKRNWAFEKNTPEQLVRKTSGAANVRRYLPCYVKPRRSTLESDSEFEVRLDEDNPTQVWVKTLDFPHAELAKALEEAELVPLTALVRGYPIVIVSESKERKRGLFLSSHDNGVVYLDVDTGLTERVALDQTFMPCSALLAIPNAATRCRLETCEDDLKKIVYKTESSSLTWSRARMRVIEWGCVPAVSLYTNNQPPIPPKRIVERCKQKLYRGLPALFVPPTCSLLKNCSVLYLDTPFAFIAQNEALFDVDTPESAAAKSEPAAPTEECKVHQEQQFLEGDVASVQLSQIEWRVRIEEIRGMEAVVRCIDNGHVSTVDLSRLTPLLNRHASRVLKVKLPEEYFNLPFSLLSVLLGTGVFDVLLVDCQEIPLVRLFTFQGMEVHICSNSLNSRTHCSGDDDDDDDDDDNNNNNNNNSSNNNGGGDSGGKASSDTFCRG